MIDKTKLIKNANSSIAQIVVTGITLLLLYRYLLEIIGAEKLGIWSLVLAISSMSQMANLGLTGTIVKYVASYNALGDKRKMILAIQTAVITIGCIALIFILALMPVADYSFSLILDINNQKSAKEILPIALLCFWLFMVTGIYQGALYGCELISQRNWILMFDSVMHLILCLIYAPEYGLIGLAYARLTQNFITLFLTIFILKKQITNLPLVPHKWNKVIFKEMFSYAANFQLITLLVMLSDPITKGFLSKFGSVSMVSYYEMANKLVQLFRSLIVNANQVLVPSFAGLKELEPQKISQVYLMSHRTVFFLTIIGFCLLAVSAPLISYLWIGSLESVFIVALILLNAGYLINTLAVPAYFSSLGTGDMKGNVVSHLMMTVTNIGLILLIGKSWQGAGVIVAWALSLSVGGSILNIMYFKSNSISLREIIPKDSRYLMLYCIVGLGASYYVWTLQDAVINQMLKSLQLTELLSRLITYGSVIMCFALIVIIPVWIHPVRKKISGWIFKT